MIMMTILASATGKHAYEEIAHTHSISDLMPIGRKVNFDSRSIASQLCWNWQVE
jgi:hypothetical protein